MYSSDSDFEISPDKRKRNQQEKKKKEIEEKKRKPFNPEVKYVNSKSNADQYRKRKKNFQNKVYEVSGSTGRSISLIIQERPFKKEVEISGVGQTLNQIKSVHEGNFKFQEGEDFLDTNGKQVSREQAIKAYKNVDCKGIVVEDVRGVDPFIRRALNKTVGLPIGFGLPRDVSTEVAVGPPATSKPAKLPPKSVKSPAKTVQPSSSGQPRKSTSSSKPPKTIKPSFVRQSQPSKSPDFSKPPKPSTATSQPSTASSQPSKKVKPSFSGQPKSK